MKRVTRQFVFRSTLEDDRHQLSLAQALLTKEIERLGVCLFCDVVEYYFTNIAF